MVRARGHAARGVRARHRRRELGAAHSRRVHRPRDAGLRRARHRPCQVRRPGRARPARRPRLGRDRALRGQRVGHRDCRMALHRLRAAGRSRHLHRHRAHRPVLAADPHRPRRRPRCAGARRLDRRRHPPGHDRVGRRHGRPQHRRRLHARRASSGCTDHVMGAAGRGARDPARLRADAAGAWRRRGAGARGPRAPAATRAGPASHRPPDRPVRRRDDDARDVPCASAGASGRTATLGQRTAGRPRAAPGGAVGNPGADCRGPGGRRRVDSGAGGPRRLCRHRADAPACLDRRHAAVGSGVASHQVRHARSRRRRHGPGHGLRGACDGWPRGLAVAGLRDRDCRDAGADDRVARQASTCTPGRDPVQGARERALERPGNSLGAARRRECRRGERFGDGA